MTRTAWDVHVTDAAQDDFDDALIWTRATFGPDQEERYRQLLAAGLRALSEAPTAAPIRRRTVAGQKLFFLRPRLGRRHALHLLVFRLLPETRTVVVLRILHEKMDLPRHLRPPT
jgi:plasmid stabilization system protein ParE